MKDQGKQRMNGFCFILLPSAFILGFEEKVW